MLNLKDHRAVVVQDNIWLMRIVKILTILAFVFLIIYGLYYLLTFFVTKSIPSDKSIIKDDFNNIEIYFNKDLAENRDTIKNKIIIQPNLKYSGLEIYKNTIRIKSIEPESNTKYTITLLGIKSKSNQTIKQKKLTFTTSELPLREVDENEYPLQHELPQGNDHFNINTSIVDDKVVYKVTIYAILNRPEQEQYYREQLHQYSKEALDWLAERGVDQKKYKIEFDPPNAQTY